MTDTPKKFRSAAWFGGDGKNAFMYRSWMKNQGIPDDSFDGFTAKHHNRAISLAFKYCLIERRGYGAVRTAAWLRQR